MQSLISHLICGTLVLLMVAFPKSGFYFSGTPFYALYLFIISTTPFLLIINLFKPSNKTKIAIRCALIITPFWAIWLSTEMFIGHMNISYLGGHIFIFFLLPIFFYLLCPLYTPETKLTLYRYLTLSIRIASTFGLVSFANTLITGDYLNIPYLTTGGGDDVVSVWQRNNQRGELFKLVSTYNNGNIYGLCMAILSPLYFLLEKRNLFKIILLSTLILTLSRTVWILTMLAMLSIYGQNINTRKFLSLMLALLAIATASLALSANFLGGDNFIMDSSLGNRDKLFWMIEDFRFLPDEPISAITEIPYLSIYYDFGLIGLFSFILFFISPTLISNPGIFTKSLNSEQRAINSGIAIYLFSSFSDSALLFVPSFACYSFLTFLKLNTPKHHE